MELFPHGKAGPPGILLSRPGSMVNMASQASTELATILRAVYPVATRPQTLLTHQGPIRRGQLRILPMGPTRVISLVTPLGAIRRGDTLLQASTRQGESPRALTLLGEFPPASIQWEEFPHPLSTRLAVCRMAMARRLLDPSRPHPKVATRDILLIEFHSP